MKKRRRAINVTKMYRIKKVRKERKTLTHLESRETIRKIERQISDTKEK